MKATGIVRRIDDLGRVVIPKEIRRTMRIREGDPLQATITQADRLIRLAEIERQQYIIKMISASNHYLHCYRPQHQAPADTHNTE